MVDLALLILRTIMGSLMLGHGAQKLFGWWGGYGLDGTSAWVESLGLRPGRPWAIMAGGSEFGGGVLTLLGLLNPLGPLGVIGAMAMAARKAHWGKPIWVTEGGPELPVTNVSIAAALMLAGPGKSSPRRWSPRRSRAPRKPATSCRPKTRIGNRPSRASNDRLIRGNEKSPKAS
jgi:putative oxidoreductase